MCKKMIYLTSFVLVLGFAVTSVSNAAHPNPVGWWKLDGDVLDSSGNGHDGTLMGDPAPVFVEGVFDQALDTTETNGPGYVEITGYKGILGTNPFSITAWINTSDGAGTVMGWGSTAGGTSRAEFRINSDRLRCESSGNVQGDTTLPDNEWIHVAVTVKENATISHPDVKLYLNGQDDTRITTNTNPLDMVAGYDVTIARRHTSGRWFDALIDDVRIYDVELTEAEVQQVMKGVPPYFATDASPAHGTTDVPRDVVLSWAPGDFAAPTNGHKVYFGESFDDVNDATDAIAQTAASYTPPQRPDFGTTYYWRVDEVNAPPTSHIEFKGSVWSFTTEPIGYPIENVTATASSALSVNTGPENSVNGSGMDAGDLHSAEQTDMWVSGSEASGAWIEFEFDKVYKLHEMLVWNSNQMIEPIVGFGAKGVTIEYSADGTSYATLGTTGEFARAPGAPGYAHNTTIDFGGAAAKNVRITISSNWGMFPQYSLSEVRFMYLPVLAREPNPDSGATGVDVDVTLSFRAGREAATHDVYISTDRRAVIDGTAPVTTVTEASHGPLPLDLGRIYQWKVNEVNDAETPTMWEGDVWNFRTQEYFVVENFEDYNDYPGDRIYETWADGWEIPTNGAMLGYPEPINFAAGEHILETTDIHGDKQSLPFFYDNSAAASSEASVSTADLAIGRDWSKRGAATLSLWFKGIAGSFLEAPAGTFTMSASGVDIWGTADEFRYAFKQLSGDGSIIAKVESVDNTNGWAKCGVMIRETLDAGSTHAFCCITPGSGKSFQNRKETDQRSWNSNTGGFTPPYWVKLVRQGNTFAGYHSADGVNWELQAENPNNTANPETVQMGSDVYIGLALTSHNVNAVCTAKFSNVQTTGAVGPAWSQQAIGADMPTVAANAADKLYVALSNSGGLPLAVYHDDTSATQASSWTKWNIDLQEFADKGINLSNVDKFYIGIGDKSSLQAGGSGMMLFDDARLYPLPAPSIGLVAHYPLDEVIGTTVADASGNGYDGTVVGEPNFVAGKVGQAISLDGENDYVEIPSYNGVTGIQSRTCCAWIKTTKDDAEIVSWGQNVAGQKWIFRTQMNNGTEGAIRVEVNGGYVVGSSDLRDDMWHYVAAVFETDETPDVTDVKLYVDGVQETISAEQSQAIDTAFDGIVIIGKSPWGARAFEGLIDDVRIYDYALSVAEVLELAGE